MKNEQRLSTCMMKQEVIWAIVAAGQLKRKRISLRFKVTSISETQI